MSEFKIKDKVLNMPHTRYSARSNEYLLRDRRIQNSVKDLTWSVLEKIIISFNYFCKKLYLKSLRGF